MEGEGVYALGARWAGHGSDATPILLSPPPPPVRREIWSSRASGNTVSTAPILPPYVEEEARGVVLSNADLELTRFAMELCAVMCCCDTSDTPSIARVAPIENACTRTRAPALVLLAPLLR